MRGGQLRHRIEIEQRAEVADGLGSVTTTWSRFVYCRAAIWPVKASEVIEAGRLEHRISHRIRIRYRADIDASMRVKHGTRYFDIVSIRNLGELSREIELMAIEGTT